VEWEKNQARELSTYSADSDSAAARLAVADLAASMWKITGQQSLATRFPADEVSDFLGFEVLLRGPEGVATTLVTIEEGASEAKRVLTVGEALANLLTEAVDGDEHSIQELTKMFGTEVATSVRQWFAAAAKR